MIPSCRIIKREFTNSVFFRVEVWRDDEGPMEPAGWYDLTGDLESIEKARSLRDNYERKNDTPLITVVE